VGAGDHWQEPGTAVVRRQAGDGEGEWYTVGRWPVPMPAVRPKNR